MEEQGNSAAIIEITASLKVIRNCWLGKNSLDTGAIHLIILRYTLAVQSMNFECWSVEFVEIFSSRNTA